jgi:TonB family protein
VNRAALLISCCVINRVHAETVKTSTVQPLPLYPSAITSISNCSDRPRAWAYDCRQKIEQSMIIGDRKSLEGKTVKCAFRLTGSGDIKELLVFKSSGSIESDTAAIDTIRHAAPFNIPTKTFLDREIDIMFVNARPVVQITLK